MSGIDILGLAMLVIGGLWLIIEAFKTSILWGLGCLIITPVSLVFIFVHWDKAKSPFILQLVGLALIIANAFLEAL
ncbi:MAG TPA: hypothetical protein PK002_01920 [Cellvibrio sp.]|nr:hypothetical protein [Cellvibrio sp.]